MRGVGLLALLVLAAGCIQIDGDATPESSLPAVSVTYSKTSNTQTTNGQTTSSTSIDARLTSVSGPIEDWSDLQITGCAAPASGAIDLPYKFAGCSGRLTIKYAPTGQTLYRSP